MFIVKLFNLIEKQENVFCLYLTLSCSIFRKIRCFLRSIGGCVSNQHEILRTGSSLDRHQSRTSLFRYSNSLFRSMSKVEYRHTPIEYRLTRDADQRQLALDCCHPKKAWLDGFQTIYIGIVERSHETMYSIQKKRSLQQKYIKIVDFQFLAFYMITYTSIERSWQELTLYVT